MNPIALAVALALATCHGPMQYPVEDGGCFTITASAGDKLLITGIQGNPFPLTCGQYQHAEPAHLANDCGFDCFRDVPARCVDDIHMVTEREWQEMQDKLKAVESTRYGIYYGADSTDSINLSDFGFTVHEDPTTHRPGYTVDVDERRGMRTVVVCSVLPEGTVVGSGDNCDFHSHPDPVYCRFFPKDEGCGMHPEKLPNECGTSFGCQNLDAFEPPPTQRPKD